MKSGIDTITQIRGNHPSKLRYDDRDLTPPPIVGNSFNRELGMDMADAYKNPNPHDEQNEAQYLDYPYLQLLRQVDSYGIPEMDRTGVGTKSIFGGYARYDLRDRFPLLTTKKMPAYTIIGELLWMLGGNTNVQPLQAEGITIWDEWAREDGDLGPVYGDGFRHFFVPCVNDNGQDDSCEFRGIDQFRDLLIALQTNPYSRRHLMTLWNPHTVHKTAIPCCHGISIHFKRQVDRRGVERLHCCMTQRSCDMFLGVPFNVASYSFLTCLLAEFLGIKPGFFTHFLDDYHIYSNHVGVVRQQLDRQIRVSPKLKVNLQDYLGLATTPEERARHFLDLLRSFGSAMTPWYSVNGISKFSLDRHPAIFEITEYDPHPKLEAEVAV